MINILGRNLPDDLMEQMGYKPFTGSFANRGEQKSVLVQHRTVFPGEKKLLASMREAIEASGLKNGMTIAFHHHMRNGDDVIRQVVSEIRNMGIGGLTLAATALFDCHSFLEDFIKDGTIRRIETNYLNGRLANSIANGLMESPVIMRTHGGRDRAIEAGELKIDVAFLAASAADCCGNINGVDGKSAFGAFGYSHIDALYANCTVAITDNLLPYPLMKVSITEYFIDYVVVVDSIGDSSGIESGTTKLTRSPLGRQIAALTASAIEATEYFKDGYSLQLGAGGTSLAVSAYIHEKMKARGITGSFIMGGITKPCVDMLEDGTFRMMLDGQSFDLAAVESIKRNQNHREISVADYSNPHSKGAVVNMLDTVILGATEIDTDFNVNVTTGLDCRIMGGSGGHSDTAAGSKLSIIVATINRSRIPTIVDSVNTINTPGDTVDLLVTDRGIAVNPRRPEIRAQLEKANLSVVDIHDLRKMTLAICGAGSKLEFTDKIIAAIEYRDGTLIDVIRQVK